MWPHDNGIIALGLKRYGFAAEAARVAREISEAASYFVSYRLPELYAGIPLGVGTFPVQHLEVSAQEGGVTVQEEPWPPWVVDLQG